MKSPFHRRCPTGAVVVLAAALLAPLAVRASTVSIDARVPSRAPAPLPFAVGGKSSTDRMLGANTRYLTLDGQPWFPVMGEFHFSR